MNEATVGPSAGPEPADRARPGCVENGPNPGFCGRRNQVAARAASGMRRALRLLGLALGLAASGASATSLDQLLNDPHLTPETLMRHFADFKFRLGRSVQKPEEFLASKAGDCDDFATLAAEVLRHHGYTTRLIVIHLEKAVHVVCYVNEIKGYLDYNYRQAAHPIVSSDGSLTDIGGKVAAYFRTNWHSASEFTYETGTPKYHLTAFR